MIGEKPARPVANEMVIEKLSPELEAILDEWEQKSSQIKSLAGKHKRHVFNLVFEVEQQAEGRFFLQTPDRGRIDLTGTKVKDEAKSDRIGKSGRPFRVESGISEKWICTGEEILMVNDEDKSYDIIPLPSELRGTNIVHGPLPFLFGIKAEDAKRRFQLSLTKSPDPSQHAILVVPRRPEDQQNYKIAKICLDKRTYLPQSVMLLDPNGNLETRYYFEITDVNNRNKLDDIARIFGGDRDPYRPDLRGKGYKLVVRNDAGDAKVTPTNGTARLGATNPPRTNGSGIQPASGQQVPRTSSNPAGVPRTK